MFINLQLIVACVNRIVFDFVLRDIWESLRTLPIADTMIVRCLSIGTLLRNELNAWILWSSEDPTKLQKLGQNWFKLRNAFFQEQCRNPVEPRGIWYPLVLRGNSGILVSSWFPGGIKVDLADNVLANTFLFRRGNYWAIVGFEGG